MTKSLDPDELTGPERFAARQQAKDVLDVAKASGYCFCCTRRRKETEDKGFGLAECGLKPPARPRKAGCVFEPDYSRIYPGRFEDRTK